MPSVLLVSYGYAAGQSPGAYRMQAYMDHLSAFGWMPSIVTSTWAGESAASDRRVVEATDIAIGRLKKHARSSLRAGRTSTRQMQGSLLRSLARTMLIPDADISWYPNAWRAAVTTGELLKPSAIISSSPNPTNLLVGDKAARVLAIPHIVEFRDLWTLGPTYNHRLFRGILERRLEEAILTRAKHVVTVTPGLEATLLGRYPHLAGRTSVILNGFDEAALEACIGDRVDSGAPFTLAHAGDFYGSSRQPITLLKVLSDLRAEIPDLAALVRFDCYGPIATSFNARVRTLGLEDVVTCHGVIPFRDTIRRLVRSDALVATTRAIPGGESELPSKIYDYVGTTRSILLFAPRHYDIAKLTAPMTQVTRIDPDDYQATRTWLTRKIDELAEGSLDRPRYGTARLDPTAAVLSRRAASQRMATILDGLT